MISQARRVRAELAADGPAAEADLRRRMPYGFQFSQDHVTRLEVAYGAAAGVQYVSPGRARGFPEWDEVGRHAPGPARAPRSDIAPALNRAGRPITKPLQMHEHGVIHRDLTSYNVLLDFGRPWQVKVRRQPAAPFALEPPAAGPA
jgi:hypothetical protein